MSVIEPASAKHIPHEDYEELWKDKKFISDDFLVERKMDGSRYLLYLDKPGHSKLLSRRISDVTGEYVDKTLNVPHLTRVDIPKAFWGTILDGEMVHPANEKSESTTSIMGCAPDKAVARQKSLGWLQYHVYDIPRMSKEDLRERAMWSRRESLESIVAELESVIPIFEVQQFEAKKAEGLYKKIVAEGGEGVMLKEKEAHYGKGWWKVKKVITQDVFIIGYEEPKKTSTKTDGKVSNTKFYDKGWIGALKLGMFRDGKIVEVGTCSGFPDDIREAISSNQKLYLNAVVEIKAQERTKTGAFRHPRFLKFREDKSFKQCVDTEFT